MTIFGFLLGAVLSGSACPPEVTHHESIPQAISIYNRAKSRGDLCVAARAALFLSQQNRTDTLSWAEQAVRLLTKSGDFRESAIQGLKALRIQRLKSPLQNFEQLRLAIVENTDAAAIKIGTHLDVRWLEWSLELGASASPDQPLLGWPRFIADYPSSSHLLKAQRRLGGLRTLFLERELAIANRHEQSGRWLAAITRLESLTNYPILIDGPEFDPVFEKIFRLQNFFIDSVHSLSESHLRLVLRAPSGRTLDRERIRLDSVSRLCQLYRTWQKLKPRWNPPSDILRIVQMNCRAQK